MPTSYDNDYLTSVTTQDQLYVVAASTTAAVNSIRLFNQGATTATVDMELWPLGVSGSAAEMLHDLDLEPDEAFEFKGHLCLLATDEIQVSSDVAIDVTIDTLLKATTDPAPTRNRQLSTSVTAQTTVYTAPSTKKATVTGISVVNVSGGASTIAVSRFSGATEIETLGSTSLTSAGAGAVYCPAVTWTLEATELIKVTASAAVDVIVSALEH